MHREFITALLVIEHELKIQDIRIEHVIALITVDDIVIETFLDSNVTFQNLCLEVRRLHHVSNETSCYVDSLPRVRSLTDVHLIISILLFDELKITRTIQEVLQHALIITQILAYRSIPSQVNDTDNFTVTYNLLQTLCIIIDDRIVCLTVHHTLITEDAEKVGYVLTQMQRSKQTHVLRIHVVRVRLSTILVLSEILLIIRREHLMWIQ